MPGMLAAIVIVLLVVVVIHDLTQRQHAILRTFPVVGHFRYYHPEGHDRALASDPCDRGEAQSGGEA